ncbi:hypothetical protein DFR50_107138 [Roseiarcus fermentans]|uniref:NTF2 fold immunity protein of polymorphic toxin system component n=1 Tax=Roseiarcus fermentans TaxID=1473586 RepID=A0A366FMK6_9HYPH|nr:hypothetical protein [Roseiarcus fermentans]RBP15868.1 hypothetical protein DFR50_107138 [Roseiarcus fermentans]
MEKPERDVSMIVFTAAGTQLVSSTTALALVKMVIEDYYGSDELVAQSPLKVEDGGSVWKVTGSRASQQYARGPIEVSVSKLDAAIVSLTF